MGFKLSVDFNESKEENLEILNDLLSKLTFSSVKIDEVDGEIGESEEKYIEFIFSHFYSDFEYLLKKVTFLCEESTESERNTYQVDVTVYDNEQVYGDNIAFHLAWCNEYPDRVIKSVKCFVQDKYLVYFIISRKAKEGERRSDNQFAAESCINPKDMPQEHMVFEYERLFSSDEMEMLRKGHKPESTLERWYWYMKGDTLYIHRTLTGYCIYAVDISNSTGHHQVTANKSDVLFCGERYSRAILNVLLDKWCDKRNLETNT